MLTANWATNFLLYVSLLQHSYKDGNITLLFLLMHLEKDHRVHKHDVEWVNIVTGAIKDSFTAVFLSSLL